MDWVSPGRLMQNSDSEVAEGLVEPLWSSQQPPHPELQQDDDEDDGNNLCMNKNHLDFEMHALHTCLLRYAEDGKEVLRAYIIMICQYSVCAYYYRLRTTLLMYTFNKQ